MKHGKRYAEVAKKVDRTKLYEPEEAIALAKETAAAKFDETVEIHIRTSCDGRHADQQIRGLCMVSVCLRWIKKALSVCVLETETICRLSFGSARTGCWDRGP